MVQKELEAQRELVDYGGSFQPNAPPPCKFYAIRILCYINHILAWKHILFSTSGSWFRVIIICYVLRSWGAAFIQ
jgi:hypothetical protein